MPRGRPKGYKVVRKEPEVTVNEISETDTPEMQLPSKEFLEKFSETENWFNNPEFYDVVTEDERFKVFVEVGVWKGHGVRHLASALKAKRGENFAIFAVDLFERLPKDNELWEKHPEQIPYLYDIYSHNLSKAGVRDIVQDIRRDSVAAAELFDDGSIDVAFIDASHSKEAVMRDIKAWLPKVRRGGIIAGDDWHHEPVQRGVLEALPGYDLRHREDRDTWIVYLK